MTSALTRIGFEPEREACCAMRAEGAMVKAWGRGSAVEARLATAGRAAGLAGVSAIVWVCERVWEGCGVEVNDIGDTDVRGVVD
jgi:hypothetical protein